MLKLTALFSFIIPICASVQLKCYSNAALNVLPENSYPDITCDSCRCLADQQNSSAFQCDASNHACATFSDGVSRSNVQIELNSSVCFFNRTTSPVTNGPTSFSASASVTGGLYTLTEQIDFTSNVQLSYLAVKLTSYKNIVWQSPQCHSTVSNNIATWSYDANETNISATCLYNLKLNSILSAGQYSFYIQFSLSGVAKNTINDTFEIWTNSAALPTLAGYF